MGLKANAREKEFGTVKPESPQAAFTETTLSLTEWAASEMKGDRVFISDAFFFSLEGLTKRLVNDERLPDFLKGGNFQFSPRAVQNFLLRDRFFP